MRYTFRTVEIDEDCFAIRRNGATVDVEPRVFDFLLYLIRHRQRVVSKGELLERVWHGYAVGESVLARCAWIARKVVGDPSAIRTVHARGYQWVAAIAGHDAIHATHVGSLRHRP